MNKDQKHERVKEDAKASNDFARFAAQSTILINGGAATATLAFIASVTREQFMGETVFQAIPVALAIYTIGVFLAGVALVVMSRALEFFMMDHPKSGFWGSWGVKYWCAALILICAGLVCFIVASMYLAYTLSRINV